MTMLRTFRHVLPAIAVCAAASASALAGQDSSAAPVRVATDSALPLKPARTVRFDTDEGTWMSVDVSPDGSTIVFDLLGDLYTMPIAGGAATRITSGMAFDAQPRYSPDGNRILFASDRSGAENLWLVNADGSEPHALTKGDKGQYISPEWTPDGKYIVVSRSTSDVRSSTYNLYLYHVDGGTGIKLTGRGEPEAGSSSGGGNPNYLGAAFGPDGRYVYVATKQGGFGYNLQFPLWQVVVYDRETGKTHPRTRAWGSGMRPAVSPDGRYLLYATREDSATSYRLREIATGDERWLVHGVQRDDQESRYTRDAMPGVSFTPDGAALIAAWGGKIRRVAIPSGEVTVVPFTAAVDQQLGPVVHFEIPLDDSIVTVQQIRHARPSPDGRQLVFSALDRLWIMDLPTGSPRRLTGADVGEHSPVWSPDGRWIAYVTWDEHGGDIYRVRANGRGRPERLTESTAFYDRLNYTPDGHRLVVARGPRQPRLTEEGMYGVELAWLPAGGGPLTIIAPLTAPGYPHFTRDTSRIYITDGRDGLVSMRFDGTDVRPVLKVTGFVQPGGGPNARPTPADEILIAPDGDRAIAEVGNNIYLLAVPMVGGEAPSVSILKPGNAPVPVTRVTRVGGDFPGWYAGGRKFHFSLGHTFFTWDIARADSAIRDSTARADSIRALPKATRDSARADSSARKPAWEAERLDVVITTQRDRPRGTVLLRGARLITMRGDEVIEGGEILVRDNRIAGVGRAGSLTLPDGTKVIDVSGTTIIPGWVDIHAHLRPSFGIHAPQVWEYLANLAYGVTTTRDPQTGTTDVLTYADRVASGALLGPRIFSTGPGVFWSEDISSLDEARDVLRRYSDYYNTHMIKQYGTGDRKVRQWVIMAARELGLMPTSENYLDFKKNLTEVVDGFPGAEHSYPIVPLYRDVVQLVAQSGITYTPTLLVSFGGPWGENYWYTREDITRDPKLTRWTPRTEILQRALRRPAWFHESQYVFDDVAREAAKIVAAGGRVGLGGHGQLQGLGVHWELWSIASGGMPTHDVLRVGTIFGAESIGLGHQLGSLETGKLADLQVLDGNPLEDIRQTNTLRYVMKNGRLYDANSLAEVWPRQREVRRPWWWDESVIPATGTQQ